MDKNIKAGEEILRVEGLKKYFPVRGKSDAFVKAIDGIDFDLARGETLGVGLRKEHYCLQRGGNGNHD